MDGVGQERYQMKGQGDGYPVKGQEAEGHDQAQEVGSQGQMIESRNHIDMAEELRVQSLGTGNVHLHLPVQVPGHQENQGQSQGHQ